MILKELQKCSICRTVQHKSNEKNVKNMFSNILFENI
jgi:hypothetical protein